MTSSLTTLVVLVTLLHAAAFVVMIMIRLRRDEPHGATGESASIGSCAVCSQPATRLGYDGLDPDERHDPHTGRSYSTDMARYHPLCATH